MPVLSKKGVLYSDDPNAHTSGHLFKKDLMRSKSGKIVSIKMHNRGKEMYLKNGLKPLTREKMVELRKMRK